MNEYKVIGKVFGRPFELSFKRKDGEPEAEFIHCLSYLFNEGNYSCDCNKAALVGAEEFLVDEAIKYPCGDFEDYSELKLYKDRVEIFDFVKYWEEYD